MHTQYNKLMHMHTRLYILILTPPELTFSDQRKLDLIVPISLFSYSKINYLIALTFISRAIAAVFFLQAATYISL